MSQDTVVAKRYAKALFEIVKGENRIAEVEEELQGILTALKQNGDFRKLLAHPGLTVSAKSDLVKNVFGQQVSETVLNTLLLLIENGRAEYLESLLSYFSDIANEALGQAKAIVYTPIALSEIELQQIAATFGSLVGKQLRVESVIDKSLLGGVQIRIGDRLYDGSLSGKLKRLERTLNVSQAL